MSDRDEALHEIARLAKHYHLTLEDIRRAMAGPDMQKQSSGIIARLFSYIGGIFIFAGVGVFISMYWREFNSEARVIVTLGIGFAAYLLALACLNDKNYQRAATPLFLISAVLQPMGILVLLNEYSIGGDRRYGLLFMTAYMLLQHSLTFWAKQRTLLAFGTIFFGAMFFVTLFDIWGFRPNLTGAVMGISLLCLAYSLNQSRHSAISGFWYLVGSVMFLWALFDLLEDSVLEILYLGLAAFMIFLSTYVRSRAMLFVSTLAMLGYIGYFTAEHFANTVGWPISLVIIGIALFCLGSLAVRLNNKYIRQPV
ncbi:MAG TPA: DUF2157 domain-containing protein [Methylophilaceae bacterium]|nr:DUF2157 domain-containing protein [Methylophilaceae bacterium]